jgi:hypothetical protein
LSNHFELFTNVEGFRVEEELVAAKEFAGQPEVAGGGGVP